MIGAQYVLHAEVENVKEQLGEAGSLPVIQFKIEQLGERAEKLEKILERSEEEREEIIKIMQEGQKKTDSLIDVLMEERRGRNERRGRGAQNGNDEVKP